MTGTLLVAPTKSIRPTLGKPTLPGGSPYDTLFLELDNAYGLESQVHVLPVAQLVSAEIAPDDRLTSSYNFVSFATWRKDITIPVIGQPRAYPIDWYSALYYVTLYRTTAAQLPTELSVREFSNQGGTTSGEATGKVRGLDCCAPAVLQLVSATDDYRVTAGRVTQDDYAFLRMELDVRRPARIVWYSFELALIPALVLLSLIVFQVESTRTSQNQPRPHDIAFGFTAILLAILPLRQVLVPSAIPGLTLIDAIFGMEIILLALGAVAWAFLARRTNNPTS